MSNSKFINYYDYNNGYTIHTNMYDMEEANRRMAWQYEWKLKQPVDKRTRFYKYLVDQGIVKDGETIYNRDVINVGGIK